MPSYPSAAKSFTTKNPGDTIQGADVNELQDEVTAIEQTLVTGPINLPGSTLAALSVTGGSTVTTFNVTVGSTLAAVTVTGAATLNGGQIVFPAVQVPSAGVNTLDDYEEGTWTPVIGGSGGTSGQTYTSQVGSYIKMGKFVWATYNITLSAKGTITTSVEIQGLPFTAENTGALNPIGAVQWSALATTWVSVITVVLANTTVARVRGTTVAATANATELTTADIANATILAGTILYRASA